MQYKPHEYQKYAIDYIETHPLAAVLLDMGLGKTSITLTAIAVICGAVAVKTKSRDVAHAPSFYNLLFGQSSA